MNLKPLKGSHFVILILILVIGFILSLLYERLNNPTICPACEEYFDVNTYDPLTEEIVDKDLSIVSWFPDDEEKVYAVSSRYPVGTVLRVTRLDFFADININGQFLVVTVTEDIDYPRGILGLSEFGFLKLSPLEKTFIDVTIEIIGTTSTAPVF